MGPSPREPPKVPTRYNLLFMFVVLAAAASIFRNSTWQSSMTQYLVGIKGQRESSLERISHHAVEESKQNVKVKKNLTNETSQRDQDIEKQNSATQKRRRERLLHTNTGPKYQAPQPKTISATSMGITSILPSLMKVHYHEMWNHTTGTIDIPDEYQNPFDILLVESDGSYRRPLTSLEILQNVLHGDKYRDEFDALELYMTSNDTVPIPKCMVPDIEATRELARKVVEFRKAHKKRKRNLNKSARNLNKSANATGRQLEKNPNPWYKKWPYEAMTLPLPILNLGYPKVGSSTLRDYFDCIGLSSNHGQNGAKFFDNLANGTILYATGKNSAFKAHSYTQLDWNMDQGFYPQISLLDELHELDPNSTFVFNFRPIRDWIRSVSNFNQMRQRFAAFSVPGLQMTPRQRKKIELIFAAREKKAQSGEKVARMGYGTFRADRLKDIQLAKWWCGHVLHLREYVREYPSHVLIELDLYNSTESESVLYDLFQTDTDAFQTSKRKPGDAPSQCWGKSNSSEELKKQKVANKQKLMKELKAIGKLAEDPEEAKKEGG